MSAWLKDLPKKAMVLLSAWPTIAASLTAVLAVVGTELVPQLPGDWPVKAAAWVAAAVGMIAVISAAVARVTPILHPSDKGLLPKPLPPPNQGRPFPRPDQI